MTCKNNKKIFFTILTIAWTIIIFSFSLQPGDISGNLSGSLLERILSLFMPGVLNEPERLELYHHILRKCGHFTEYAILGVLSIVTMFQMKWHNKYAPAILYCILVASVDETIQLFVSDRAGRVQDVLIDTAGALTGIAIVFLFRRFVRKK